jgi:peptide/nickel transport system ATP-binding protein
VNIAPPLLDVQGLTVRYAGDDGPVIAVRDVSFSLRPGQALGIVGESGSGKSSIAGAILDLLGPGARVDGKIMFDGIDLATLSSTQRRAMLGSRIGSVFQDPFTALNPAIQVGRQIAEGLVQHRSATQAAAHQRAVELLAEMGIARPAEVARAYPHQLSGGMKQRALIAAALACEPALLILDEPTTALDVTVEAQILDLLAALRRRKSVSVLFISHNLGVVRRVCDDVAVMYASQMVELGTTAQVLWHPAHPYSKGLLASLPPLAASTRASRLPSIPGQMSGVANPEAGCLFSPRCPFSEGRCVTGPQALVAAADGHAVRCWKAQEIGAWPAPPAHATMDVAFQRGDSLVNVTSLRRVFQARSGIASWRMSLRRGRLRFRRDTGALAAVDGVSLSISPGEVLGLVGESGCGKSTLGRLVLRLMRVTDGSVEFDGQDVTTQADRELDRFRQQAQIVFQNVGSSLNPRLSVGQALARPLALFNLVPPTQRKARVEQLLDMVRLPNSYSSRYPHQLSGGERQRVAIARALATQPRFVVCDEPVSALDVSVQAAVVNLLADLRDEFGLSYLFISHDLAVVAQLSDRIAVMYRGRLCETGLVEDVLAPPFHPYTRALLASVAHQAVIEAEQPGMAAGPGGCPFRARCQHRMAICDTDVPLLRAITPTHAIACHLPTLPGALPRRPSISLQRPDSQEVLHAR